MRTRLVLLFGQAIALGLMMAFLVVPASSLFLVAYGAAKLPFAYIGVAVAGVAVSWAMNRAQRSWSLHTLAVVLLASFAITVSAAWLLLVSADATWATFPLLIMFPLSIPLGFVIIGSQAGRLLDLQQMKSYFPRVVGGFSVGFAIGGLLAAWLARAFGDVRHLLVLDVAVAAVFIGLVAETARRYPAQLRTKPDPRPFPARTEEPSGIPIWRIRLVQLVFGYQLLSAAVTQLLDFMVWERAAARYPDANDLAAFLGIFGAIINVVSILFVFLLAGKLLGRFGIRLGLPANPAGVIVILAGCLLAGFAGGPATLAFFVLICASQVTDIALTDGTTRTSVNATYQALRPAERLRAQTSVEAAGIPLALGLVGVLLLTFDALDLGVLTVAVCTAVISLVWLIFAVLSYRAYGLDVRRAFLRRDWDPTAVHVEDEASRAVLERLLSSDDKRDVRLGLDVMADANSPQLAEYTARLLSDTDEGRKQLGIEAAAKLGDNSLAPAVADVVVDSTLSPDLRTLAANAARGLGITADALEPALSDPDATVRLAVAAAVARSGGTSAERGRNLCLESLLTEGAGLEAGLAAVAHSPDPAYVGALLALAEKREAPLGLAEALAAHVGYAHLDAVRLLDLATHSPRAAQRVVSALGASGDDASCAALAGLLFAGDRDLSAASCRALAGNGYRLARTLAAGIIESEAGRAVRAATAARVFAETGSAPHLVRALDDDIADSGERIQNALGLAHGTLWLRRAIDQLSSRVEGQRALAVETLEVELGHHIAGIAIAFLDPASDMRQRRDEIARLGHIAGMGPEEWLTEFLTDPAGFWQNSWMQACALHSAATMLPRRASQLGRQYVDHPDAVVSETAQWVLAQASFR